VRIEDGKPWAAEAAELLGSVFTSAEMLDALNPATEWRVAVTDEGVVGFISWKRKLDYMYWDLTWLAVSGETRGQGVGRKLVDTLKAEVVSEGGGTIRVETPCDSEAREFYERCGFELAVIYPDFYEQDRGVCVYLWHYD
jgi:ribosomal protein S18 acetylase RimI-like enzyme